MSDSREASLSASVQTTSLDGFTAVNFLAGLALGYLGVTPVGAALVSAIWELGEDRAKAASGSLLPASVLTLDSKSNAICDIVAVVVGAGIGGRLR